MNNIKIYQAEIDDGLQEQFGVQLSITYEVPVLLASTKSYTGKVKNIGNIVGKLDEDEFIFQFPAILATAGVWNKNDQVFDKYEVWKARYTPLNKPSNIEHQPDKVVGHTNRVFAITDEETPIVIPDSVEGKPNQFIPDIYHLLTVDSFYKYNSKPYQSINKDYSDKIQKIYEQIIDGELKVSMECIFANFDYAILTADGSQKIIERNDKSSFLTKKLKRFGGTGEYEGARIGMLMRDIVFTGKGITSNPANPSSVIFSRDSLAFASQIFVKSEDIFNNEINSAYINNDNGENIMKLEEAQAKITELETQLAETKKLADELASVKPALETATAEINTLKAGLDSTKEELNKVVAEKVTVEKTIAEVNEKLATAQTELNTVKAENLKIKRVGLIEKTLGLETAEAEKNYVILASLSDDNFNAWLNNTKSLVAEKEKLAEKVKADIDAQVAKAAEEAEKANKLEAAKKLEEVKKPESTLGVASTGIEEKSQVQRTAVKSVFARKKMETK